MPKATDKQKAYIRSLQKKNGFSVAGEHEGNYLENMSKATASGWIALLLEGIDPHRGNSPKHKFGGTSKNSFRRAQQIQDSLRSADS